MDLLQNNHPFITLIASGPHLGMPEGTVGNSEIGHLHMGAGRRVFSDRVRIFESIEDKSFFKNPALSKTIQHVKKHKTDLHILGIISFYSSHGSIKYLEALMDLAKKENVPRVFLHGMLGRRGEKPEAGAMYVNNLENRANELGNVKVVSIIGRHWSLDREENWDRIQKTYDMLVSGVGIEIHS
jgi:2,3-bisphosphoglycerate-independent phosphoglycerate mutase